MTVVYIEQLGEYQVESQTVRVLTVLKKAIGLKVGAYAFNGK
jgi:hypothetical protein